MERRRFALSWGRKIFFGIGWPLLSLVALNYFQGQIIPRNFLGSVYFISTFIGHFGLITAGLYFLLYTPLVALFPNYYFSRIWSVILILLATGFLFIDTLIFGHYRFHLNGFILDLLFGGSAKDLLVLPPSSTIIASVITIALATLIWVRGESIWRSMQRRFSNPNSNWYLVLIAVCLLIGHTIYIFGDATGKNNVTRLAQVFPIHYKITAREAIDELKMVQSGPGSELRKDFNYPKRKLECAEAEPKNILFITIDSWKQNDLRPEIAPALSHYTNHGINFLDHHSGSNETLGGIFSLIYSLPGTYLKTAVANKAAPVFVHELEKRNYEFGVFYGSAPEGGDFKQAFFPVSEGISSLEGMDAVDKDQKVVKAWSEWIDSYDNREGRGPFFGFLFFSSPRNSQFPTIVSGPEKKSPAAEKEVLSPREPHDASIHFVDGLIHQVIEDLTKRKLIQDTIIVVTGDHGPAPIGLKSDFDPNRMLVPLFIIWPGRKPQSIKSFTSHYDVVPTIMREEWKCKNPFSDFSYGTSLFTERHREVHVASSGEQYGLIDFKKNLIIKINSMGTYDVVDFNLSSVPRTQAREGVILSALRDLVQFKR